MTITSIATAAGGPTMAGAQTGPAFTSSSGRSIQLTDFSEYSKDGTDWAAAANAAIAAIMAQANPCCLTIAIPAGQWNAKGTVFVPGGIRFVGQGKVATVWNKMFDGDSCFQFTGTSPGPVPGQGGGLQDMSLWAASGAPSFGIFLFADANNHSPDYFSARDVLVTGGGGSSGVWTVPLYIDGSLRGPPNPEGVRDIHFSDCEFFDATNRTVYINTGTGVFFTSCGFYQALGAPSAWGVEFAGTTFDVNFTNCNGFNAPPSANFVKTTQPGNSSWNGVAI